MEGGVVPNKNPVWRKLRQKDLLQPKIDNIGVGCAIEEHGSGERSVHACGYTTGAWPAVACAQAINTCSTMGIAVRSGRFALEAGFVDINKPIFLSGEAELGKPLQIFSAALSIT